MPKGATTPTEAPEERAVLVFINPAAEEDSYMEEEMAGLCEAARVEPIAEVRQRLEEPIRATFLGKGKAEEVADVVKEVDADIVLFDGEVTGPQQRFLEEKIGKRVVDRTQLILDIFARRARTKEGMLQVELAQLTYMLPKLMAAYTKFERQKGGIGMRGPGETKLESDRRMVRDRIARLEHEIEDVKRIRDQQRSSRRKHPFPFTSLVGYTSAGKSTLMNRLAGTELLADAMPFATLDATTRKIELAEGYSLFLTDTVGFIRNLPTKLVAAFRSTLEEVTFSDFIVHVVDVSNPNWELQHGVVVETLNSLGAGDKPVLTVFNKADLVKDPFLRRRLAAEWQNSVVISAKSGEGLSDFKEAAIRMMRSLLQPIQALVPYSESALIQDCYNFGRVLSVEYREDGIYLDAELASEMYGVMKRFEV